MKRERESTSSSHPLANLCDSVSLTLPHLPMVCLPQVPSSAPAAEDKPQTAVLWHTRGLISRHLVRPAPINSWKFWAGLDLLHSCRNSLSSLENCFPTHTGVDYTWVSLTISCLFASLPKRMLFPNPVWFHRNAEALGQGHRHRGTVLCPSHWVERWFIGWLILCILLFYFPLQQHEWTWRAWRYMKSNEQTEPPSKTEWVLFSTSASHSAMTSWGPSPSLSPHRATEAERGHWLRREGTGSKHKATEGKWKEGALWDI